MSRLTPQDRQTLAEWRRDGFNPFFCLADEWFAEHENEIFLLERSNPQRFEDYMRHYEFRKELEKP